MHVELINLLYLTNSYRAVIDTKMPNIIVLKIQFNPCNNYLIRSIVGPHSSSFTHWRRLWPPPSPSCGVWPNYSRCSAINYLWAADHILLEFERETMQIIYSRRNAQKQEAKIRERDRDRAYIYIYHRAGMALLIFCSRDSRMKGVFSGRRSRGAAEAASEGSDEVAHCAENESKPNGNS